jgi:hypothetical protein
MYNETPAGKPGHMNESSGYYVFQKYDVIEER